MIVPVTEKSIVFAIRRGGERVAQRVAGTRAIRRVDCIVAGALHGDRCRPCCTYNKQATQRRTEQLQVSLVHKLAPMVKIGFTEF